METTTNTVVKWGVIAGAVVAISTGISQFTAFVGTPPFANVATLEEVQEKVVILNIDVLNQGLDRLFAQRDLFVVNDKPVPVGLQEQIRQKCREIRGAGGSC